MENTSGIDQVEIMWDAHIKEEACKARRKYQDERAQIWGGMNDCILFDAMILESGFVEGVKSDAAKEYWQRGMCTEKQVNDAYDCGWIDSEKNYNKAGKKNMYSAADLVDLMQFIGSKFEGYDVIANIAMNEWYELRKKK